MLNEKGIAIYEPVPRLHLSPAPVSHGPQNRPARSKTTEIIDLANAIGYRSSYVVRKPRQPKRMTHAVPLRSTRIVRASTLK